MKKVYLGYLLISVFIDKERSGEEQSVNTVTEDTSPYNSAFYDPVRQVYNL